MNLFSFFISRWETILDLTVEHFIMVLIAMAISILLGITVGIIITMNKKLASIVLNITNVMMTIPSLALFSLLIPIVGIGKAPAIVGLVAYTQLPIVRNVYTGITNIKPSIIEAARGMGLTEMKILYKIKIPLAFSAIMTGIRTAVVMGIGIGAIAGYIGAGGLGVYIFRGISRTNDNMVIIGAILISLIAILADKLLEKIQKKFEV
ncbi:ABC transporter permease [Clostridium sp.]|uniref:ABC transporter permease n=1 Tax=Clostridium sp. TaxID=1506 RepID=UPI001A5D4C39|nr:ABC transporter permease [Clostridium sp.]MBK5236819.1 ABC transporter permease [Clostridium sp.]